MTLTRSMFVMSSRIIYQHNKERMMKRIFVPTYLTIKKHTLEFLMAIRIINYLNEKVGKRYNPKAKTNQSLIRSKLSKGHSEEDFKLIIDHKVNIWMHIPQMKKYLKPTVLFADHNFARYLKKAKSFFNNKKNKNEYN